MRRQTINSILFAIFLLVPAVVSPAADSSVLGGEVFTLDRAHSLLDFTARQVGFGRVRGTFKDYEAAIFYVEDDLLKSSVSVVIDVKSIDTGSGFRDDHLRSADFFDAEQFPRISFHSERVVKTPKGFVVIGPLTIRDVTQEVRIPFTIISGKATDQFENQRIVFDARLTLNPKNFGVVGPAFWNNLISEEIEVDISLAGRVFNYLNPFSRWRENSIGKILLDSAKESGIEMAHRQALDLWKNHKEEYLFNLSELYKAGMQLAQSGQLKEAISIFDVAAELYEDSAEHADLANLYATLGETYASMGDREQAIQNVEKALVLNPNNTKARELLRHLKGF